MEDIYTYRQVIVKFLPAFFHLIPLPICRRVPAPMAYWVVILLIVAGVSGLLDYDFG
jgi:hypothetical protein